MFPQNILELNPRFYCVLLSGKNQKAVCVIKITFYRKSNSEKFCRTHFSRFCQLNAVKEGGALQHSLILTTAQQVNNVLCYLHHTIVLLTKVFGVSKISGPCWI